MSWTKKLLSYYKNNPEDYWFKRKLYGWGWTPVKWQGWVVVLLLVGVIIYTTRRFSAEGNVTEYIITLAIAILLTILIGYWKGEPPKWQWGLPRDEDSPNGD